MKIGEKCTSNDWTISLRILKCQVVAFGGGGGGGFLSCTYYFS